MDIKANIDGIRYLPYLCRSLKEYSIELLPYVLSKKKDGTFLLKIKEDTKLAVSWWVTPKRTRSYPYARVYDTLGWQGKRVTIIPIFKDEGKEGDRDFLQWDTISLMSLLDVYVIIAYYSNARKSTRYKKRNIGQKYENKITDQNFDVDYISSKIYELLSFQSDALHWNTEQVSKAGEIGAKAIECYERILNELGVEMHSRNGAEMRIQELLGERDRFIKRSRERAQEAQKREVRTIQPKENISGIKATLTITNYLGGEYFFTCDEVMIEGNYIQLTECKHTSKDILPSEGDIKDGLLKMVLFTNLKNVTVDGRHYESIPVLKLTTVQDVKYQRYTQKQISLLSNLALEAERNKFKVLLNSLEIHEVLHEIGHS